VLLEVRGRLLADCKLVGLTLISIFTVEFIIYDFSKVSSNWDFLDQKRLFSLRRDLLLLSLHPQEMFISLKKSPKV